MFHLDEYIRLPVTHPASFRKYLQERFLSKVPPLKAAHLVNGEEDAKAECARLNSIINKHPIDVALIGIGENGHLAFNDPHVADFKDPQVVKVVSLDEKNRHQQVDPSDNVCFNTIEEVPTHAITITIPALFKSKYSYAIVPGKNKADAIYHTLTGHIQEK